MGNKKFVLKMQFDNLANYLRGYYSNFKIDERYLFTGHSHQAWPDEAFEAIKEYQKDTSKYVDNKWGKAFAKTQILRDFLKDYYNDKNGFYSLGQNTHTLLCAFTSALNLKKNDNIITSTNEFHSLSRQLQAFESLGIKIKRAKPNTDIKHLIDKNTKAVMMSHIFFDTGERNLLLEDIAQECDKAKISFLIDDYHATNVIPISLTNKLSNVYLLCGGYKYLQWGEGNCFLRYPKSCNLSPSQTGWFSSFSTLEKNNKKISFDENNKFVSSTYEPFSQYRAVRVLNFFKKQKLSKELLENNYKEQRNFFKECLKDLKLKKLINKNYSKAGFVSIEFKNIDTSILRTKLEKNNIYTDNRKDKLRFGFAPYIKKDEIIYATKTLKNILKDV